MVFAFHSGVNKSNKISDLQGYFSTGVLSFKGPKHLVLIDFREKWSIAARAIFYEVS